MSAMGLQRLFYMSWCVLGVRASFYQLPLTAAGGSTPHFYGEADNYVYDYSDVIEPQSVLPHSGHSLTVDNHIGITDVKFPPGEYVSAESFPYSLPHDERLSILDIPFSEQSLGQLASAPPGENSLQEHSTDARVTFRGSGPAKKGPKTSKNRKYKRTKVQKYKPKKKKTKKKIFQVVKGSFISGGNALPKKVSSLKACMAACNKRSTCLAGDYNKHSHTCYTHTATACNTMQPHKASTHFSKIPCDAQLDVTGVVNIHLFIGQNRPNGLVDKSVKSIQECLKKCLNMGGGIAADGDDGTIRSLPMICHGIDYDFVQHKCYFHTMFRFVDNANMIQRNCELDGTPDPLYESDLLGDTSNIVHFLLCPV